MILRLLLMSGHIPVQAKLAYLVVMMDGSSFKSAQRKRLVQWKQTAMHRQGAYMINASQERKFHKYGTKSLFYSSHNHSICILSFIYLLNSMECLYTRPELNRRPSFYNFFSCFTFYAATCTFPKKWSADRSVFFIIFNNFISFSKPEKKSKADDSTAIFK